MSHIGYVDDLAAASTDKRKVYEILKKVHRHSVKWRYIFNVDMSAVLVYGEAQKEHKVNSLNSGNKEGKENIKQNDHVGLRHASLRIVRTKQ